MGVSNNMERYYERVLTALRAGNVQATAYQTGMTVRSGNEPDPVGIAQFETYMRVAARNLGEAVADLKYTVRRVERECATVDKVNDRVGKLVPVIGRFFAVGQVVVDVKIAKPLGQAVSFIDWYDVGRGKQKLEQELAFGLDLVRGWNEDASVRNLDEIRRITLELDGEESRVTAIDNDLFRAAGLKPEKH